MYVLNKKKSLSKTFVTMMVMCLLICASVMAQRTVTGTVTNTDTGDPLAGVTVQLKGTTTGALTDVEGSYSVIVEGDNAVLVFSFIGFAQKEVEVGNQATVNVALVETGVELDAVVMTALGVSRDKKAIGYSVTEVDGEEFTEARETNVVKSLAGKVAGVSVSAPAAGPAGSSRVIIRGNANLAGNNQPLYVVDGVPIDNTTLGTAGMWGGVDRGDGISSINPDDIETISVLKGPSASALYGSRGQNGVILITTKTGKNRRGIGVEVNSNFVLEDAVTFYDSDDRQFVYGQGTQGQVPDNEEAALATRSAWGAVMDGQPVLQFNGETRPYVPHRDNMDKVFRTGNTLTNTLSLNGGNENATFRLSASDLRNEGIFEGIELRRNTFTARGTSKLGEKLSVDVKVNYINEKATNRPTLSDTPHNPGHVQEVASSVDLDLLQPFIDENGDYIPYTNSQFRVNPFFGTQLQFNEDIRDRIIAFASAKYDFTSWLSLQLRGGTDFYTTRQTDWDDERTPHLNRPGRMNEREWRVREDNFDFLFLINESFGDFSINANVGGNRLYRSFELLTLSGNEFIIPGLRTVKNTVVQNTGYGFNERKINSLYGSAQIGYRDYLFLDVTGRNDWSSTLPDENNSYFYPSASLSFAFTDAFDIDPDVLSFGKVRLSYAEVGGDTDPYQLALTYSIVGLPHLGNPQGQIAQGQIPQANLRPTDTRSYEAGLDLRFFGNRLGLDITYYNQSTTDQILSTDISSTSGFGSVVVNAGEITNEGVEVLLTGSPITTESGFRWDMSLNFARNRNEVIALDDAGQLESLRLEESRARNAFVEARLGQPYGAIVGRAYARDDNGNIIHDADGLPLADNELQLLGVGVPDWTAGFNNTFTFKGISIGALLDLRWGGQIHSNTNRFLYAAGHHINTLEGREEFYAGTGGIVGEGVTESGEVNTVVADPEQYFGRIATEIAEEFVYDADFIKLRQATISYNIPREWLGNTPFQALSVSIVGRNLALLYSDIPNVDPESTYSNGNGQGLEYSSFPQSRSFGFNVNVRF